MDDITDFIIGRIGSITALPITTKQSINGTGIRITEIPEPTIRMDMNGYSAKETSFIRIEIITPITANKPDEWVRIHSNLKGLMREPVILDGVTYYISTVNKVPVSIIKDKWQNHGIDIVVYYFTNT